MTDPKKTPSNREYQLLAILVRNEWTQGTGAELNGRQIARAYAEVGDEVIPYGTVYTLLAAMEDSGWLRSREDVTEGRRTRWYRINRRGIDAVERWRSRSAALLALTTPPHAWNRIKTRSSASPRGAVQARSGK